MKQNFAYTGPTGGPNGSTGAPSNTFYQIDNNEAIVTVITLPPLAAYYSFQSYMFSRPFNPNYMYNGMPIPPTSPPAGQTTCQGHYPTGSKSLITPDCLSYQIFGYFDNAINNVVVQNQSGLEFSSDGSQAIAIITTPNAALYTDLRNSFAAFGNQNLIFLERMPTAGATPLLQIGASAATDDTFSSIFRYAIPAGGNGPTTPGGMWAANVSSNVLVYRVQLPGLQASAIANPTATPQSCNNNETVASGAPPQSCPTTSTGFANDIQLLIGLLQNWVASNLPQFTYAATELSTGSDPTSNGGSPQGPVCITNGNPCVGSTADNNAYRSDNIPKLPNGAPAFVIGVNHSASTEVTSTTPVNNATYTSIAASDGPINAGAAYIDQANLAQAGFPPVANSTLLSGSAALVLNNLGITIPAQDTTLMADLPNLYITLFERPSSCTKPYCVGSYVTTVPSLTSTTVPYIPLGDSVTFTERGYMLPSVNAAPPPGANTTGAMAKFLESPYVFYAVTPGGNVAFPRTSRGFRHH